MLLVRRISNSQSALRERQTIFTIALIRLSDYKISTADKAIDTYLQQTEQLTLKQAVYHLLRNFSIVRDIKQKQTHIIFKNPEDEKLAHTITYGVGALYGSKILRVLFK